MSMPLPCKLEPLQFDKSPTHMGVQRIPRCSSKHLGLKALGWEKEMTSYFSTDASKTKTE